MKTKMMLLAVGGLVAATVLAGTASAGGAGACVLGSGFSFNNPDLDSPFVGVNVGTESESGVYDNAPEYEAECCAETGQEPDCFRPIDEQ